ncbi:hypothetical protein HHK36_026907 [Tetracentron sinense]|uniref:NAC domain-containing protein n=1 Tax=Tetracentron sinense TaxID=13715 RepID=A0A834YJJ5_TETSI|nr:hypothetical protein HHK36_026907 [Tetracentron sinense]
MIWGGWVAAISDGGDGGVPAVATIWGQQPPAKGSGIAAIGDGRETMREHVAKFGANEWYFFSFRDRKYANGFRANRATASGYWKATGKDRLVFDPTSHAIVGMRKTLVFHHDRAPNGIKTGWVMHEFRLENPDMPPKEDWVICRVFHKGKHITKLETTIGASYANVASSSPIDQTMPSGYQQIISSSQIPHHQAHSQTSLPNLPLLNPNFLEFPQEMNNTPIIEFSSKGDDEYGFLFNMSLEDYSLGDGGPPNLAEMRFEDDNSIVFL